MSVPCDDVKLATNPLTAQPPDGAQVLLSHTCSLCVISLLRKARLAHFIPGLASHLLLSVVCLYNVGCEVTFAKID